MSDYDQSRDALCDLSRRANELRDDIRSLKRTMHGRGQEWPDNGDYALKAVDALVVKLNMARLEMATMKVFQEMV